MEEATMELLLIGWLLCAIAGAVIADRRGGKAWLGALVGAVLGPIGVLLVAVLPPTDFGKPPGTASH